MKSSMAITKSAAFRFMLLLHLFLKVKMCVGFVDAVATGDSDINYDDSEEWLGEAVGGGGSNRVGGLAGWARPAGLSSTAVPAPSNLMRWEDPAAGRYRMHHVRHEQHYLKHRPAKVPTPSESTVVVLDQGGPYQAHTVTTSTVTGADQPKSHHHSHHHHQQQQHHRPHSQHHAHHNKHHRRVPSDASSEEEASPIRSSVGPSYARGSMFEHGSFKDTWDSMSGAMRDAHERQVAINRKRSASSFHSLSSNALPDTGSRSSRVVASRERTIAKQPSSQQQSSSINPESKNYFEQLLNNYKSSAPYYKELHQSPKTPQTKSLPPGSRRNQRSSAEVTKSKANQQQQAIDGDLDYLYDDETEESVQNDAPSAGGVMSTRAPTSTTSTTTTTTTTPRSILSGLDSEEASGSDGSNDAGSAGSETDTSYRSYIQQAYAMPANPRRNGNNRYNSITRTPSSAPTVNHHNSKRIDPVKQVSYPGRYQSFTEYKQANFGSKDAVERSYSAYSSNQYERTQAKQHMERMIREGICKVPRPKIVPASDDRTKLFTPQCTILHRCEDDTGCCGPMQTCAPKSSHDVQLYFYVQNAGQRQQSTIALTFSNHTECHCVDRSSSRMPNQNSLENSAEGSGGSSGSDMSSHSCTCPRHFKSVIDSESQCYCDCLSSDRDCIRFKEGFERFSMETRKCIRSKRCNVPRCEYGMYNRDEGRCPKKSDRFNEHFSQYR